MLEPEAWMITEIVMRLLYLRKLTACFGYSEANSWDKVGVNLGLMCYVGVAGSQQSPIMTKLTQEANTTLGFFFFFLSYVE